MDRLTASFAKAFVIVSPQTRKKNMNKFIGFLLIIASSSVFAQSDVINSKFHNPENKNVVITK